MSVHALQDQIREAQASGARIRVRGSGSRSWLHAPFDSQARLVDLDCSGLNQIRWIDAEDRTCCVEAGVTLTALAAALREFGLALPFWDGVSQTIGGAFLGGTPSLCAAAWGHARDQVLGGEWILANGDAVRTGSRVVKSVAGYDLTRLFVGSRGRLAVCTSLTLRLRPLPSVWAVHQAALAPQREERATPWMAVQSASQAWTAWTDPLAMPSARDGLEVDADTFEEEFLRPLAAKLQEVRAWTSDPKGETPPLVSEMRQGIHGWTRHEAPQWPPSPSPWLAAVQRAIAPDCAAFV